MTDDLVKQARDAADLSQIGWTGEGWVTLREDFVRALANRIEALEREVKEHKPILEERERLIQHLKDLVKVRDQHIAVVRREALEEAAAYHDAEVVRLEETIASNSAYLERMGQGTDDYSNDLCRKKQAMHRMHAAAIRALKEKE